MINKDEILAHARRFNLSPDIIEKDYIINWILVGIANHHEINKTWVFKGGTCLKKCYFGDYRFSEDLDFTLVNASHISAEFLTSEFQKIAKWIYEQSGIEVPNSDINFNVYSNSRGNFSVEGRIRYRGPLQRQGNLARVKLDLTNDELLVLKPDYRNIYHPYSDILAGNNFIQTYCLEEIFSEKLRALVERLRPRDLYDVIHLYYDERLKYNDEVLRSTLQKKCDFKKVPLPSFKYVENMPQKHELIQEWNNMLAHQISDLKPYNYYWELLKQVLE